jgi:hypothetical protein
MLRAGWREQQQLAASLFPEHVLVPCPRLPAGDPRVAETKDARSSLRETGLKSGPLHLQRHAAIRPVHAQPLPRPLYFLLQAGVQAVLWSGRREQCKSVLPVHSHVNRVHCPQPQNDCWHRRLCHAT